MDPLLRAGLELPPLPSPALRSPDGGAGDDEVGAWRGTARAASGHFGSLWLSGGPAALADRTVPSADPCTLAGGLAEEIPGPLLVVRSPLGVGRHPAVLARDLTAIDLLSSGRAAAVLFEPVERPVEEHVARLAEAAAVCRAVLADEDPVFEGRYFHVAGAVNRPGPLHPGRTPVLAEVGGATPPDVVASDAQLVEWLELLVRSADAVVVTGGAGAVASWRRRLGDGVPLVWRGRQGQVDGGPGPGRERLTDILDAGADGLVVPVPPPARALGGRGERPLAARLATVAAMLATALRTSAP